MIHELITNIPNKPKQIPNPLKIYDHGLSQRQYKTELYQQISKQIH